MTGAPIRKSLFLADTIWFGAAAMVALIVGTVGDRVFRHLPLGWHYQTAAQRALTPPTSGELSRAPINLVELEEVDALLTRPDVIVLDARPRVFFDIGHLPGARSLSREQFEKDLSLLEPSLRIPGQTLLIYCSDAGCEDSARVARALQERGFGPLLLYLGGFAEWEAAGRTVDSSL